MESVPSSFEEEKSKSSGRKLILATFSDVSLVLGSTQLLRHHKENLAHGNHAHARQKEMLAREISRTYVEFHTQKNVNSLENASTLYTKH